MKRTKPAAPPPSLFSQPAPAPPPEPPPSAPAGRMRFRILLGMGCFALWAAVVVGRLFDVQVVRHDEMAGRAVRQREARLTIPPRRGEVLDRSGHPLAMTIMRDSLYAVPGRYEPEEIRAAARELGKCLGVPSSRIARMLRRDSRFSWLKRRATPPESECAQASAWPVGVIEEYGRAWPSGALAAHVLGFVGTENTGLAGIESAWDDALRGEPGMLLLATDGRRTSHASRVGTPSRPGRDLQLTLDLRLQSILEEELARGLEEIDATHGAVILVETRTGDVLGMASAPAFHPARYQGVPAADRANRAVAHVYEPGSVFKMVTIAAALNEGVAHESEVFDTNNGRWPIGRRLIRDWKPLGTLTLEDVFAQSSNIGTLQVAERVGSEALSDYIRAFGFGARTGLGLGGEGRGLLPGSAPWRQIRLATVSFGQGIAVTAAQMAQAANVFAGDGMLRPLRLVQSVGGVPLAPGPERRVLDEATAGRMRSLMERVVDEGTGSAASVAGFRIAGKTGTAQRAVPGGYSDVDYISTFAGFAPADEPLFTAVVMLEAQKPRHSGAFAARVFGRIAARALWRRRRTGEESERVVRSPFHRDPARLARVAAGGPDPSLRGRLARSIAGDDGVRTAAAEEGLLTLVGDRRPEP